LLWQFLGQADFDGQRPALWPEYATDPVLALAADCLPAYRVAGGMGATTLMEGFDRAEVAQVMRWHAIADEADAWDVLRYAEAEIRQTLGEQRRREAERRESEAQARR